MNKTPFNESPNPDDDMLPEYHFDYQKAKPNRFAAQSGRKITVVVLDEDVAQVFNTPESVNKALKALIEAVPRMSADDSQNTSRFQGQSEQRQKTYSVEEARKQYPRAYEPWNAEEDEQLRLQYNQQASIDEIATEFQRQPGAIKSRLKKLGLL
jgi:DNA-directed RNA polymerase specialized sigma24 family protein